MRPSLLTDLTAKVRAAFVAEGLDPAFGRVQISDRPELGQFQSNGALAAAKAAKMNPLSLASQIQTRLETDEWFSNVSITGPGFINIKLMDWVLAQALAASDAILAPAAATRGKVVVDFGGPNVAKAMHVGHLRSSIIGDALQRHLKFAGFDTKSDVHLGDWGKPMGMLITEVKLRRPELPYFDPAFTGPYPVEPPVTMEDLETLYPIAAAASKADPVRDEEARTATAELQQGRAGYRALWRHFIDVSIAGIKREFASLGVYFDLWKGEADVDPLIGPMLTDLKARGIAELDDGALIVRVGEPSDKKEMPPLMLVKRDGGVLYETTDVATIIDRVKSLDPDLVLYVVDQRQHEHFEKVFRGAIKAGYAGKAVLEHVGFGTMNGADGKPFKTRAGGVLKLYDLIEMAKAEAEKRLVEAGIGADYPPEERATVARQVGLAAIKFADLSNYRLTNYIFDLERFTKFEGKTGPYLQYAAVRVKSLLRKAMEEQARPGAIAITAAEERDLALAILRFPDALEETIKVRAPNVMCDYAYTLAQRFSSFYAAHHIMSESDTALRASRLALAALTLRALETALELLGIEVPERM
ncbi:Arginine--tRNA ligase [Alphaproteobacteria bacterium SO-S41]|nr:Arginine--tRNA ligase [Alphaproteobacteria bacterium SO-S41]